MLARFAHAGTENEPVVSSTGLAVVICELEPLNVPAPPDQVTFAAVLSVADADPGPVIRFHQVWPGG